MHAFLISIFASVIQQLYRGRYLLDRDVNVQRGAIVSGIAQTLVFLGVIIYRGIMYQRAATQFIEDQMRKNPHVDKMDIAYAGFGGGVIGYLNFLVNPITLIMFYFAFEGVIRVFGAVVSQEVLPSLPFVLFSGAHSLVNRQQHKVWVGERIVDQVTVGNGTEWALKIESCRTKPWDMMMTVSYNDVFYEMIRDDEQGPPRRFVYLLRRIPPSKLIRGLHHYDPEEELHQKD